MKTTVSYHPEFGNDTFYNQTIKAYMTHKEFTDLNESIVKRLNSLYIKDMLSAEEMSDKMYLKQFYCGKNFSTRTQKEWFVGYFNICNKRILKNRNAVIEIIIQ